MTSSIQSNAISLKITQFPQNLLIPNIDNIVALEVINNVGKRADFRFEFKGENIDVKVGPEEINGNIKLESNEAKKIELKLTPKINGYGKLIINVYWLKITEYVEKVQKVRTSASRSRIEKILAKTQILNSKTIDTFSFKDFTIESSKNGIKKSEKELDSLLERYHHQENGSQVNITQIDLLYKNLAKSYLGIDDIYKALEYALKLSKQEEQLEFYYNFIRTYAFKNLEQCLQIIKDLNDQKKRNMVLAEIALDYTQIKPEMISKIISLMNDPSMRDKAIIDVISLSYTNQFDLALNLCQTITEDLLKVKVLFNLMKELNKTQRTDQILQIANSIVQIIQNTNQMNVSENKFSNPAYSYLKDVICIIAELDSPDVADKTIKSNKDKGTQERLTKDLFDIIYEMVDEVKTKIEPTTIHSQFYLLNTCVSQLSNELQQFALLGGNVSFNVLINQFDFNFLFLSLFSLNFSIFPFIDRIYNDLQHTTKKSIAYYIYPSINNLDSEELSVLQRTLKRFFPVNNLKRDLIIFNLDFIPYLGKPTVIFASNSKTLQQLKLKVEKKLGEKATIMIDEGIFKGGTSLEPVQDTLGIMGADLVNLVLSYEFLNDYNLFKMFFESLF